MTMFNASSNPKFLSRALLLLGLAFAASLNAQVAPREYELGKGDTVRIVVFQNPDLTVETRVNENGTITYPLVGSVTVGGMTVPAAERAVAKALSDGGFLQKPQVNIVVLQNRGNQVSVLGAVNRPGRFPLETVSTRVSEMIAIAGGIAPIGADFAILTGVRDGKPFRVEIDVAGMFLESGPQSDLIVTGGDAIYVQRMPVFYIYGQVTTPGSSRVERGMTVRQALAQSGGPTLRGTERNLRMFRRSADGKVQSSNPDLNDLVQANDVLYISESLF